MTFHLPVVESLKSSLTVVQYPLQRKKRTRNKAHETVAARKVQSPDFNFQYQTKNRKKKMKRQRDQKDK